MTRFKHIKTTVLTAITLACSNTFAVPATAFNQSAQQLLTAHVKQYKELEYFSGAALSISVPGEKIHNYYAGTVAHDANSAPIDAQTLFQIGSITKSYTGALILQLDKDKFIDLNSSLDKYLPQYGKWGKISLKKLLNMTSGLPNYTDTPLFNTVEAKNPSSSWSNTDLIAFVYPDSSFSPPLKTGYFYTNTGYILLDMIVNKATQHSFSEELTSRIIHPARLENTFYPLPNFDSKLSARMAHGYNYNQYDNPALVGADLVNTNVSWAAAAGGIVSNTEDIIKWVQALFIGNEIIDSKQKRELMAIVSTKTGKPIAKTSAADPQGFGLGVANIYNAEHPLESMWFYEGETLGFRAMYIYVPCNKVIISAAFNSATNDENDHGHDLLKNAYALVLKNHPGLRCH